MAKPSKRDIAKAFGLALREARLAMGASQEALALDADVDRTYISLLERGLRQPTISTIISVSSVVGLSPEELFGRTIGLLGRRR